MQLEVDRTDELAVPAAAVAAALRDPAILAAALPGEAEVAVTGPGVATVVVTTGLAGTRGTYRARVHVLDRAEDRWQLRLAAAGEPGTAEADLEVDLHAVDDTSCALRHRGRLQVEGRLSGVGRAVLAGAVDAAASSFTASLTHVIAEGDIGPAAGPGTSSASAAPAGSAGAAGSGAAEGAGDAAARAGAAAWSSSTSEDASAADQQGPGEPSTGASARIAVLAAAGGAVVALAARWLVGRDRETER